VRVQFLLGPAGSGKTFRCLADIRTALRQDPAGAPLVFLAPKQATFQIERQLLADAELADGISGYSRLHILSFERLAQFVFEKLQVAPPKILSTEGRVMVLRALLQRHEKELRLFRQSAPRPGFAVELSTVLAEVQQHQLTSTTLLTLAGNKKLRAELQDKLHDLALLLKHYEGWLDEHHLQDANRLLEFATTVLRREMETPSARLQIEGLWLDGFAEMTPQELDFLAAIIPFCGHASLAFCLETTDVEDAAAPTPPAKAPRLSIWSAIRQTFAQCLGRLKSRPDCRIKIVNLPRRLDHSRFTGNPSLAQLEKYWAQPDPEAQSHTANPAPNIQIVTCQNPDAEAAFAAREILKFVRRGNRFRDCALLVRNLDAYHQVIARTFRRHGIPFFLDRRESVAHHPLTELTRSALRLVAFDWQHDDWFAALKAGFSPATETEIDILENNALKSGWRGRHWREPLPDEASERLRKKILPPFEKFYAGISKLKFQPAGAQLAALVRELWRDLKIENALERWTADEKAAAAGNRQPAIHATVFEQMNAWLDNLALAFPDESSAGSHTVHGWLPILEAGLVGLTVGVIPPVLDEVLVGAIDRARNPNLKFALIAGVNESVFPATPATPAILTNFDRDELAGENVSLGPNLYDQLARERYLGYIACTRASEKLVVTNSRQGNGGKTQNPSSFIAHLQKIFPQLGVHEFAATNDWREAESAAELISTRILTGSAPAEAAAPHSFLENKNWGSLGEVPVLKTLLHHLKSLREPNPNENLPPDLAEKLYGPVLTSSVSRLEEFAQCPFRFFIHSGLRAGERKIFELDARERGTFQHEVLRIFHERLVAENKRWRDLTPAEARNHIGHIADDLAPDYREGLLHRDAQSRFDARVLTLALQDFVGTLIAWMHGQYEFDPVKAELDFGFDPSRAPAWTIDLGAGHQLALRGKIDRIDLCRAGDRTLAVVTDYKSSQRKLDKVLLQNGIQLQLLGYLAAVRTWPSEILGTGKISPAGVFYVNLRGQFEGGGSRDEILNEADEARRLAYRHTGRFDAGALNHLDRNKTGDQFSYRINQDGSLRKGLAEALPPAEFQSLLDQVEVQLREMGQSIFAGEAGVDPYRKGTATACEYCDYRASCRIDPWTHQWRVLRAEKAKTEDVE
jgi:ATP-dependent helicase/nuclease subunit B